MRAASASPVSLNKKRPTGKRRTENPVGRSGLSGRPLSLALSLNSTQPTPKFNKNSLHSRGSRSRRRASRLITTANRVSCANLMPERRFPDFSQLPSNSQLLAPSPGAAGEGRLRLRTSLDRVAPTSSRLCALRPRATQDDVSLLLKGLSPSDRRLRCSPNALGGGSRIW